VGVKSYGQFCSVAKALDIVGDRWTLLVLRELLVQGPCRYTDLAHGLPGIASNLLSDRLRMLEDAGLVRREAAPPPVATTLFHLTERGRATEPVVAALARWGISYVDSVPGVEDEFRPYWFPHSVSAFLHDRPPGTDPATVQLITPIGSWAIEVVGQTPEVREGVADAPDLVLEGHPRLIIGLLSGSSTLEESVDGGLSVSGDAAVLGSFPLIPT
jgi:DNA-binding HxlR family transcriptional regulator